MGECVRPMFGYGAVFHPEFFGKLMTAFPECLYQYFENNNDLPGLNSCVQNVMKTQLHASTKKNMKMSIAVRNSFLIGKFLPRIAAMIATNSVFLPQRLPAVFKKVHCLDPTRLNHQDMSLSEWNFYGLHVDISRNIQVLLKKFFPSLRRDSTWTFGHHPIHQVHNSLKVTPTTVFNKLIHRKPEWTVVDDFKDIINDETMLVTDFFVLWPLYHHTLTAKKPKKTIAEYNTFLKGTSGETLRKLVKSFGMEGGVVFGYPIHMEGCLYLK